VELFLKHAAKKKRTFQVIVAECAPHFHGQVAFLFGITSAISNQLMLKILYRKWLSV